MLTRVGRQIGRDHLSVIAAGIGFWAMLAIFPAVAALVSLYGLIADPSDIIRHLQSVEPFLPADAYGVLSSQVQALIDAGGSGLTLASVVGLLFALWSARLGTVALIDGLNVVYNEEETRNIVVLTATSLALTLLIIAVAIVAMILVVAVPAALSMVELGPLGTWVARVAPWPILAFAIAFAIGAIYRYGPRRANAKKRWVSWGAAIATLLWVAASVLFSFYVANFADYNKMYGSLGAIVILLLWFYISAFAVLLGAEINAEMELQTSDDTTTGPPAPMGERGAYVADNVR